MTETDFKSLPLPESMLHNLRELGFASMTPVQAESLPSILENKDVIAQAKTGSGKTAAFGIGLLTKLKVKKFKVQALVLCPTRELADQVAKELRRLARFTHNIKILTLSGGVAFGPQLGSLRHGAHIIVGTPGRVQKHLDKHSLSLEDLETLVLDEADRMLDMGFIEAIDEVISFTPKDRQTLLFSATFPDEIRSLSESVQTDAINIQTISHDNVNKITEYFFETPASEKLKTLINVLSTHKKANAIVFCNTKIECAEVSDALYGRGIDARAIHGDLEQYERNDVFVQFANHSCTVLVATDVAARGLDIKELGMVINFDLPHDESTYTHRIGRTGRAGEEGVAVTMYEPSNTRLADEYKNSTRIFDTYESLRVDKSFKMEATNATLVIEGGKKEKVRAGDLLGALTGDAGIEGKYVGKIDIYERQSYVAIHRDHIKDAHDRLKKGKIKGKKFSVWILD